MSEFDDQLEFVFSQLFCKKYPNNYWQTITPTEKITKLIQLQEQYYQMLKILEENGVRPIPEKWQKWHKARFENRAFL